MKQNWSKNGCFGKAALPFFTKIPFKNTFFYHINSSHGVASSFKRVYELFRVDKGKF